MIKLFVLINLVTIVFSECVMVQDCPKLSDTFRLKQLEPPTGRIRMVIDTDTYNEVDDQFALTYAVLSGEK